MLAFDSYVSHLTASAIPHNSFMDLFFGFFSLQGFFVYIWVLLVPFVFLYKEVRSRIFITRMSVTLALNYMLFSALKLFFARPRPFLYTETALINAQLSKACPTDFSFPSGHATIAIGIAVVMAQTDKKRSVLYYVLAILVCLSRIYLQCHFVGDVIIGALLGYSIAFSVCAVIKSKTKGLSRSHL